MNKKLPVFIIILLALIMAGCSTTDNASNKTQDTMKQDGNRIISTTVALTEIMDKLDLDLVGVPTTYKDLPERYKQAKEVGLAMQPDMEIIKSLKPTDVLTVTTLTSYVKDTFDKTETPATYVDMESVDGMYQSINKLGKKYDRVKQAKAITADFDKKLADVEQTIQAKESPTVLILLGVPGSYLVATENSYVGDLVKRAGGVNAVHETDAEYISANTEHLQQSNPDIILRMAHGMPDKVIEMFNREFQENDIWKHFKAVKHNRVYDLEETLFGTTANLAAPEALEKLANILYP